LFHATPTTSSAVRLDPQYRADPLADRTITDILDAWPALPEGAGAAQRAVAHAEQWRRLGEVNRLIAGWQGNADLSDWADPVKIRRAELLFASWRGAGSKSS
jgi:hypothetical protein